MKHYIWLSVLLALGVVQASDAAKAEEKTEAVAEPAATESTDASSSEETVEASPSADDEAASGVSADSAEDNTAQEDGSKKSKKSKKSKRKSKKGKKGKKGKKIRKNKSHRKSYKGGSKVSAPSSSVLNAYMNRVQNGEMYSTTSGNSMTATMSDQGGCATGKCGLAIAESTAAA
jgi:hypothetical protein